MRATFIIICALIPFSVGVVYADIIHIPADYPTIQEGIDAAVNGDTVLVAPGTYVENIDFTGKAITLTSEHGPSSTVIDGSNPINPEYASVVIFKNGESNDSILQGFTLTNGAGSILPSYSANYGGGIYCYNASSPTVINNLITGNSVTSSGGGIFCFTGCSSIILNNTITYNTSENAGGGVFCSSKSGRSSFPIIMNNFICKNSVISSSNGGGGLAFYEDTFPILANNTIVLNTSSARGGGIWSCAKLDKRALTTVVFNTILWNNAAPIGPEVWIGNPNFPSVFTISFSDLKGGINSVFVEPGCILNWGTGMIDADPLFVDPANNDFHLTYNSPCRDTGDNTAVTELYDFEGDPRIAWGETVDMGADEFYTHLYCTGDATPGQGVDVKLIGQPTNDAMLILGTDYLIDPTPTVHGAWWLVPPYLVFDFGHMPWSGVIWLTKRIPPDCPVPFVFPAQGMVRGQLTNLCVLEVR